MKTEAAAAAAALSVLLAACAARAEPAPLEKLGVTEKLGTRVPASLEFVDQQGKAVRLGDYFDGERPVVLITAYFRCPMLCGLVLKGMANVVDAMDWTPGKQYRILTVSFDPEDTPRRAQKKQTSTLARLQRQLSPKRWPFLTGTAAAIDPLLEHLGLEIARDPRSGEYAHPAVAFVLTPNGTVSRYLYGIDFPPRDLKLALLEASEGQTGSAFERVLMQCYSYDPASRRYALFIDNFMRLGGVGILGGVGLLLAFYWRRERARRRASIPANAAGHAMSTRPEASETDECIE